MKVMITQKSNCEPTFKYKPIKEERPHCGYRIQKILASNSKVTEMEAYLCEREGKRTVLAITLAMAKRVIDAREGYLKEGVPGDEDKAHEP